MSYDKLQKELTELQNFLLQKCRETKDTAFELESIAQAIEMARANVYVEVVNMLGDILKEFGSESWKAYVHAGQKIPAIKEYRAIHGCGLKEAKEAVEAYMRTL